MWRLGAVTRWRWERWPGNSSPSSNGTARCFHGYRCLFRRWSRLRWRNGPQQKRRDKNSKRHTLITRRREGKMTFTLVKQRESQNSETGITSWAMEYVYDYFYLGGGEGGMLHKGMFRKSGIYICLWICHQQSKSKYKKRIMDFEEWGRALCKHRKKSLLIYLCVNVIIPLYIVII